MIKTQNILDLLKGDFTPLTDSLTEKAESVIADMAENLTESLLNEMTPGHKAMMKQHLDNVSVEDDTDELTGDVTKPKKRKDARIKNIKRPDDRDAYNQLNDFAASKSPKNTNFVGKTYTTNERALRSESIDEGMMKDIAVATNFYGSGVDSYEKAQEKRKERRAKLKALFSGKKKTVKEEVEQLDELSQEKLAKYKDHAETQILRYDGKSHNTDKKFSNRVKGLNTLGRKNKAVKEEIELEEAEYNADAVNKSIESSNRAGRRIGKKESKLIHSLLKGHGGSKKPVKEEVEQLDELSKAKLGDYIKKASHDVATRSAATGRYGDRANRVRDEIKNKNYANYQQGEKDSKLADKFFEKSWQRRKYMAKAVDKITKD
jgi:hypothetical protein